MTEQRTGGALRGDLQRVIDWSSWAGWAIAIGEWTFIVLACGLVGGIVGGFIDAALALLSDDWVDYGRTVAWSTGAVSGVIGVLLVWVRRED